MATGFSRSIEGGHDVIYDHCCTTCARKNLNAEALYYCKDCRKLFCEGCEQYHDKFTEGHSVLGRKEVARWGDVKPVTMSLKCDEHQGKKLKMYCEDHDRVCCHTCISVKHRACKQVQPVSDVSKGIQNKPKFKSFLAEAAKTQSSLKNLFDKQENNIKLLEGTRSEITSTFRDMRQKFNEILDSLEEDSTTELDRLLTVLKEQVTSNKEDCSDIMNKIQKLLDDIENLGKQCDELAFQGYKKCSEHMTSAEDLLSSIKDVDYKLEFTPDVKIEQYLSSLKVLGDFHTTPSGLANQGKLKEATKTLDTPDHTYTVMNKQTYCVRTRQDTDRCHIIGMCQLPNGQIAIVDQNNTKVKLLSTPSYSVLDEINVPSYPWDICYTTGTELVVTVCYGSTHEIQFINAGNRKLSHNRTVKLDHDCFGIDNHNADLYVSSENALYVYSILGKKIKKLYEDTFDTDSRVSCSYDGGRIYITQNTRNENLLLTLDKTGNTLSTFSDPDLQKPTGVCVADNGSMFVSGRRSKTILQVNREGKKMATLATDTEPVSLCYKSKTQALLVGQRINDSMLLLKLKSTFN